MTLRPIAAAIAASFLALPAAGQDQVFRVPLSYAAPGAGPTPNFSPKGTLVRLATVGADVTLPSGAARPAKAGTLLVGPGPTLCITVLATADRSHPLDLSRLYIDRNRNRRFDDDGPALIATPTLNEKTKA